MSSNILTESGLTRTPKLEQAMAWLVENGPLHEQPDLPPWMLRELVKAGRIARLRRGLYLVPDARGTMLSLPAVGARVAPRGYLSFYGALVLHGLTDQDTARWVMVTDKRQSPIRYGQQRLEFVAWPKRLRGAHTEMRGDSGSRFRIATPEQALCDTLEAPRLAPNWPELIHVLRTGVGLRKISLQKLGALARGIDSPALARRLGFLLELSLGRLDRRLLDIAQRSHDHTRLARLGTVARTRDARWRLELPRAREDLVAAVRE